jgi:hypothetical protein
MQDLKEVYASLQAKKKEKKEISKMFQDALKHNGAYQKILEDLNVLKEQKKSIETQAKAESLHEAQQLDDLKEDIKSQTELLSDIALTKFMNRETIEIVDEEMDSRLVPVFTVRFKKEEGESYQTNADAARAETHADRLFAPVKVMQDLMRSDASEEDITEKVEAEEEERVVAE